MMSAGGSNGSMAVYRSALVTSGENDCFALGGDGVGDKITIPKIADNHDGIAPPCQGALPANVTMWVP